MTLVALGAMPIAGVWAMSMAWQRMPGQTWFGAAASFLAMWVVMMVAMMLPSVAPALWRHRRVVATAGDPRAAVLTVVAALGYACVWMVVGVAVFTLGAGIASLAVQLPVTERLVPVAVGVVVFSAGVLQFSGWKARHLACWRASMAPRHTLPANAAAAWQLGVCLGRHCSAGSAGLTAILCVVGIMDVRAMAAVTVAVTVERLAPGGDRAAQIIGAITVGAGLLMVTRAL